MSLVSALYTGVTGIRSNSAALQAIGNNVANVNTNGFKSSAVRFADLVGSNLSNPLGRGVMVNNVQTNYSQGSFENTGQVLDLAIDGDGFFVLSDDLGLAQQYTRTGAFELDADGYVVTSDGMFVQGYLFNESGNLNLELQSIALSSAVSPPNATGDGAEPGTGVTLYANLNADDDYVGPFDVANPTGTSNFYTSVEVYDSLGNSHTVTVYFTKQDPAADPNSWDWNAVVDADELDSSVTIPVGADGAIQASGELIFDTSGALQTSTLTTSSFNFAGGVELNQAIGFNFGDAVDDGGTGYEGTTQFASASLINYVSQDGYAAGTLRGISIDTEGVITGVFSNGRSRSLAQVALATFQNQNGLLKVAGNRWADSPESGAPNISTPGSGSAGNIISESLELSNVDISGEFVKLISSQRALQASSRVLSTSDDMLEEVVNLKR